MPDPAIVEAVLMVALLWVIVDRGPAFLQAAHDLNIGLFRPWRGDPWPRGVQEDDDFRFDWRPARTIRDPGLDVVVDVDVAAGRPVVSEPLTAWLEDDPAVAGSVSLERPERVEVHRARR